MDRNIETKKEGSPETLADMRQESLGPVLWCLFVATYLWYLFLGHPGIPETDLWGPLFMIIGLVGALIFRKQRLTLASMAVISGITAAATYRMWNIGMTDTPYVLAIVVSLTGLLFSLRGVIQVTFLCGLLVAVVGWLRWGYAPYSTEILSPILVITAVGILSSLAVRNLYLTLYWSWERTMAAQQNEEKLRDRQAQLLRTLKTLDITRRQLDYLNFDLARAHDAANEARLAKQQFAANVSHELRTPLNIIMAFSEMMYLSPGSYGDTPLPRAYRADIREIYRSSKHLLQLTEDVLKLSQLEAQEIIIYPKPIGLRGLISEALDIIRPLIREKNIKLRAELPDDLPLVFIDSARIKQVLINLLNNARRFTEQGSITVEAVLEGEYVKVTVADTGLGIPPDKQHKVFQEFQQVDGYQAPHQEGSGLGLAICKKFIEMHGTRIWLESDGIPGRGCQFHFTLPLTESKLINVSSNSKTRMPVRIPTRQRRPLLLLERDQRIVQMLEGGLEEYQIIPVDNVAEVPRLINEMNARAVVLNVSQKREAWHQRRWLQKTLSHTSVPIFLCPLVGQHRLKQAMGVIDYLEKPITPETLTALLDRLDKQVHRVLVVDDDPRMVNLVSRLLHTAERTYEVVQANNGQQGLTYMRRKRPDLVLTDLTMPEMDGHALLTQMQQDPDLCDIPVAVISAHVRTSEEERQLSGDMLFISTQNGFTNSEVITYLRGMLNAVDAPSSSPLPAGQVVQYF